MFLLTVCYATDDVDKLPAFDAKIVDVVGRGAVERGYTITDGQRKLEWRFGNFGTAVAIRKKLAAAGYKAAVREE